MRNGKRTLALATLRKLRQKPKEVNFLNPKEVAGWYGPNPFFHLTQSHHLLA